MLRRVSTDILNFVVNGASETRVRKFLNDLKESYLDELKVTTKVWLEAALAEYDEKTAEKVIAICMYVLPQYIYAVLEGEDISDYILTKFKNKYEICINN